MARGREDRRRRAVPRRELAALVPSALGAARILEEQNRARIPELVPLRWERMLADPFAFYRGTAAVMAADLANGPSSGIEVASCGDAHLLNFGVYAAPDRALVFDLNDFDEVALAPAEWDLKRLTTSVLVGARHLGHDRETTASAVDATLVGYRDALRRAVRRSPLDRYYSRVEPERVTGLSKRARAALVAGTTRARSRTSDRAFRRLVAVDPGGRAVLRGTAPGVGRGAEPDADRMAELFGAYRSSVAVDVQYLLAQYRVEDIELHAVGVGSVGTRCYLAVLRGTDGSPLILQIKEAGPSVLVSHGRRPQPDYLRERIADGGEGARVVAGQRVMQAASDVFLGEVRYDTGDYYVRQFHDMKGSAELESLTPSVYAEYAGSCGRVLAAAHARSPRAGDFADYLGGGRAGLDAIRAWSRDYAEKSHADFVAVRAAVSA